MYQIKERAPYIIKGKKGKEYKIPQIDGLNIDDFEILIKYNETDNAVEKVKICKEFFLHIAPELEDEKIGDVEYFRIFEEYNKAKTDEQNEALGES